MPDLSPVPDAPSVYDPAILDSINADRVSRDGFAGRRNTVINSEMRSGVSPLHNHLFPFANYVVHLNGVIRECCDIPFISLTNNFTKGIGNQLFENPYVSLVQFIDVSANDLFIFLRIQFMAPIKLDAAML